jgi:hypothetical protein
MRGNEGVIGGCCGRHGGLSLRLRPDHGSPWRDPHFTDCVEEDRPVWRRRRWLWGRLRVCFCRTGRQKQRAALEAGRLEVERSHPPIRAKSSCGLCRSGDSGGTPTGGASPAIRLSSIVCCLISRNPVAAARCSRARAAGGSSPRSAGAILPECAARAARRSRPGP